MIHAFPGPAVPPFAKVNGSGPAPLQLNHAPPRSPSGACGAILPDYFYYTWGKNRANNSVHPPRGSARPNTTGQCCGLCGETPGCRAFSFSHKAGAASTVCRLHRIPLPPLVPAPGSHGVDSGNMLGPAPKIVAGPAPKTV